MLVMSLGPGEKLSSSIRNCPENTLFGGLVI